MRYSLEAINYLSLFFYYHTCPKTKNSIFLIYGAECAFSSRFRKNVLSLKAQFNDRNRIERKYGHTRTQRGSQYLSQYRTVGILFFKSLVIGGVGVRAGGAVCAHP